MHKIDTTKRKAGWRTEATHETYMAKINSGHLQDGCRLCDESALQTFSHWKIIDNEFPYDRVAKLHHMIIPIRHTDGNDISDVERLELETLKQTVLNEKYNYFFQ